MLNKLRLLTPGPTPLPEDVRLALSRDMIHHRKQDFMRLMEGIQLTSSIFRHIRTGVASTCSEPEPCARPCPCFFAPGERCYGGRRKAGERWRNSRAAGCGYLYRLSRAAVTAIGARRAGRAS